MKLSPRDAPAFFAKPDPARAGILIHGQDAMRVALKRQQLIKALIGPEGEAEMRFDRIAAADLRKDRTLLGDSIKASGFFPGARAALVEDAGDGLEPVIATALTDWREGDAMIVVTAGQLNARSKLRKLFEGHRNAFAAAIYDDPPSRAEIEAALKESGLANLDGDAMAALTALSRALDPGDFRQLLEKTALYKIDDPTALTVGDVMACAPASTEADVDELIHIVAESQAEAIGPLMRRLQAQGVQPVSLCINTLRHFRILHTAAADPAGPGQGLARARPPVFGPRRDRMQRQAERWGVHRLEQALSMLVDTDLTLRSSSPAPTMAVVERMFVRLARIVR